MEKFVFVFLVFWGLKVIAEKYALQRKIGVLSLKWRSRFLYGVSECSFCFEHHLAIVPTVVSLLFFPPEWRDVFLPLMISGLSNVLKRK